MVPILDISALFGSPGPARDALDAQVFAAASDIGFLTIAGIPDHLDIGADTRADLLRLFDLPAWRQRQLWKRNFAPENFGLEHLRPPRGNIAI